MKNAVRNAFMSALLLSSLGLGCRTDREEKPAAKVEEAQEHVDEARKDLRQANEKVAEAKDDYAQAQNEYIRAAQARLDALDRRIAELGQRTDEKAKQAVANLRAERDALAERMRTANQTAKENWETFKTDLSKKIDEFERRVDEAFK